MLPPRQIPAPQRQQAALTSSPDETVTPALVPSTWWLPFAARENFSPLVLQMLCAGSHYAHIYIHTRNTSHLRTHSLACKMTARVQKWARGKKFRMTMLLYKCTRQPWMPAKCPRSAAFVRSAVDSSFSVRVFGSDADHLMAVILLLRDVAMKWSFRSQSLLPVNYTVDPLVTLLVSSLI